MSEDKQHIDYFELISRYLSGNARDAEVKHLEEWVLSSAENKSQFQAYKQAWILSGMKKNHQNIDVEAEWKSTAGQLFPKDTIVSLPPRVRSRRIFLGKIAAAAAVVVLLSVLLFRSFSTTDYLEVLAENKVLEDRELPDGTHISLNQYSSVKFTKPGEDAYRRVELNGDAFFEVQRDTSHPFLIQAQEVEVEVLGTSFYVDSRKDQPQIQVMVQSGSVAMTVGQKNIILTADETGIYTKLTGELIKKQSEDANYLAWKTDTLVFEDATLETIVFALNRKFHAQISIADEVLKTCKITATYEQKSLEAILRIIEGTLRITALKKGEKIIFSGAACN